MAEEFVFMMEQIKSKCPICSRSEGPDFKPFCSKRCADIDLGKWLKGDYRIQTNESADLDIEPSESG